VLVGTPQLGFNPFSAVKSAARGVYHVAADPRVQRAAASAAQAYAPGQYAQVTEYADRARGIIRPPGPMGPGPGPMMPGPAADDDAAPAPAGPVQRGNLLLIGGAVVVGLVLFLAMRK